MNLIYFIKESVASQSITLVADWKLIILLKSSGEKNTPLRTTFHFQTQQLYVFEQVT